MAKINACSPEAPEASGTPENHQESEVLALVFKTQ